MTTHGADKRKELNARQRFNVQVGTSEILTDFLDGYARLRHCLDYVRRHIVLIMNVDWVQRLETALLDELLTLRAEESFDESYCHARVWTVFGNLKSAKATLEALEQLSDSRELVIPSGTSIFEATSMILRRGDILRVKLRLSADSILALLRSRCRGRIRGHHLTTVVRVQLGEDGSVSIK